MTLFGPKHTLESVAARLIHGLENGTLTVGSSDDRTSRHDDRIRTADALVESGDRTSARALLEQALSDARKADDDVVEAEIFGKLASIDLAERRFRDASERYSAVLKICERHENSIGVERALYNLACVEALQGRPEVAIGYLNRARSAELLPTV